MRIALVNDTSTSRNQGCQVTMHMLNRGLESRFPGARIERVYLTSVNHVFRRREARRYLAETPRDLDRCLHRIQRDSPEPFAAIRRALQGADIVVINGEGSMLEHQPNARLIYTAIEMAHRRNIPAHLINFTAHVSEPQSIEWARHGFNRCESVCVREPLSYVVARRLRTDIKIFPDMAVALDVQSGEMADPCVMVGAGSAATRIESDSLRTATLRKAFDDLCRKVAKLAPVRLIGWHRDEWLREISGPNITYNDIDFVRYASIARNALLNFTGRHHGCVMSVASGCPFLTTTANCFKNYGDAELYGSVGPVLEMEHLDVDQAFHSIQMALRDSDSLRRAITARRDELLPYAFGALENIVSPTGDLVDAGLVQPAAVDARYVQHRAA